MSLERLIVWVVAVAAIAVTVAGTQHPPAPSDLSMIVLLLAVVALPLAFVFSRMLLTIPARRRGW